MINHEDPQLPSEKNTPTIQKQIHTAAWKRGFRQFQLHYEHGQWWMTKPRTGASWSVVDTVRGFDFEQLDAGEDD